MAKTGKEFLDGLARLAASTATFKVLLFPQHLLTKANPDSGARNDYGHTSYADERARLLAALTDTSAWAVPGGVVIVSGDVHTPEVYEYTAGEGLLQINPCPGGTGFTAQQDGIATADNTTMLWWEMFPASGDPIPRYYGTIEDEGTGPLVLRLKDSHGNTRYKALIEPGSNTPTYTRQRVGR